MTTTTMNKKRPQMKTFKELLEAPGAPAQDSKVVKDGEQEVKNYKPRSKGEEDFVNDHKITKIAHPVATDAQFTGEIKRGNPDDHVGGNQHAPGEKMVKQGSSRVRESFSSFAKENTDGDD